MKIGKLRYLLVSLFTGVLLFSFCYVDNVNSISFAQSSPPDRATFAFHRGSVRVYPNGRTPIKLPSAHEVLRSSGNVRDQLWIAGIRNTTVRSLAHLQFWRQNQRIGPLVQAGPDRINTLYTFPCRTLLGAGTYGWGLSPVGSSACERIIVAINNSDNQIASKITAQEPTNESATHEVKITRSKELVLIRAFNSSGDTAIDVLVGEVQVTPFGGTAVDIVAGNRYVQSSTGGRSEPIDLGEVAEYQSIQDFLNEANWSPEVSPLLDEFRSALASSPALTPEEQEILDTHNQLRAAVNVPPISWSADLDTLAQDWADTLSRENDVRHRPRNERNGIGENIAAGSNVSLMLSLWADEESSYDPSTGSCSGGECKHYTQMVWRNTTEVGCGVASHGTYGQVMVCNYRPPGNYTGQLAY